MSQEQYPTPEELLTAEDALRKLSGELEDEYKLAGHVWTRDKMAAHSKRRGIVIAARAVLLDVLAERVASELSAGQVTTARSVVAATRREGQ